MGRILCEKQLKNSNSPARKVGQNLSFWKIKVIYQLLTIYSTAGIIPSGLVFPEPKLVVLLLKLLAIPYKNLIRLLVPLGTK